MDHLYVQELDINKDNVTNESTTCPECGGKKGKHKNGCSKFKPVVCPECGGRSGRHHKSCSKYKPIVCEECGGKSNNHKPFCSKYKPRKKPEPCPECGVVKGHLKTCSHYKVTTCPECGSSRGHYGWCSRDKKCPECGYSIRSRTHAPSCSHYNEDKAIQKEIAYQKTMKERYGVTNSYFMPGHAENMIRSSNRSEKTVHISKLNRNIAQKLVCLGVDVVELEYELENRWFDIYCEYNGNRLIIERNQSVSHNFDYDFMCATGKLNFNKGGKPKQYHLDLSSLAEKNGYKLVHWYDWYNEDNMYKLILPKLGMFDRVINNSLCSASIIDNNIAIDFALNNSPFIANTRVLRSVGLFYKEELVSVVCFDSVRNTNFMKSLCGGSVENCYYLKIYCNKFGTNVSDYIKQSVEFFKREYNPRFIIGTSDYNISQGTEFKDAGFCLVDRKIAPNCLWNYKNSNKVVSNSLVPIDIEKVLRDCEIDCSDLDSLKSSGMDNNEIMLHYGFLRIYDSGYKTWLMKIDN